MRRVGLPATSWQQVDRHRNWRRGEYDDPGPGLELPVPITSDLDKASNAQRLRIDRIEQAGGEILERDSSEADTFWTSLGVDARNSEFHARVVDRLYATGHPRRQSAACRVTGGKAFWTVSPPPATRSRRRHDGALVLSG
jgi:hypothetical protein